MKTNRTLAWFLCLVMVVSLMVIPSFAESTGTMTVSASQTSAQVGDTVTFTVSFTCSEIKNFEFRLSIPEGLTLVNDSVTYTEEFKECFTTPKFNFSTLKASSLGATPVYTGTIDVMTFDCSVDENAWGNLLVTLIDTEMASANYTAFNPSVVSASVSVSCNHNSWKEDHRDEATCSENGTIYYVCTVTGCNGTKTEPIPATGNHDWDEGEVTTEPTCTEKGVKTYTCSACGDTKTEDVPANGHSWDQGKVTTEPTCTEKGVKTYTCTVCGDTKTEDVDANGHKWGEGVENPKHTCTEKGVMTFTCGVCGATKTEDIAATGHDYGDDGICKDCGAEKPNDDPTPSPSDPSKPIIPSYPSKPSNPTEPTEPTDPLAPYLPYIDESVVSTLPFTDVKPGDWFYDDVAYVYGNGLMNGVSSNEFAPLSETTRGMIVTILWRMEGQPAPANGCQFNDVASGSYYEQAIAWAAENGIVTGISDTEFCPNNNITREQFAAILYRYAGYKGYDTSCSDAAAKAFADYGTISGYAVPAMEWACDVGLINGISGKLEPTGYTTRAQAAAILHRFCENIAK